MHVQWKRVAMIMLMGLLVAGPFAQIQHAAAADTMPELLAAAKADNAQAAKMLTQWMTQMDSMMKTPMSANEKQMAKMLSDLGKLVKLLIDQNKRLISINENK